MSSLPLRTQSQTDILDPGDHQHKYITSSSCLRENIESEGYAGDEMEHTLFKLIMCGPLAHDYDPRSDSGEYDPRARLMRKSSVPHIQRPSIRTSFSKSTKPCTYRGSVEDTGPRRSSVYMPQKLRPDKLRAKKRWRLGKWGIEKALAILTVASLVAPTAALDHELVPAGMLTSSSVMGSGHIPEVAAGTCSGVLLIFGGYVTGAARSLLGPLMGISSVLWFVMRNDAAIHPRLSWM